MARLADDIYLQGFKPALLSDFVGIDELRDVGRSMRDLRELIDRDSTDEELVRVLDENPKLAEIVNFMKKPNALGASEIRKNAEAFCRYVDDHPSDVELGRQIDSKHEASSAMDKTLLDRFWNAVVINADDVHAYAMGLYNAGHRYEVGDVGIQAPLFDTTFVEFHMPDSKLFHRGGVLIEVVDKEKTIAELGSELSPGSDSLEAMRDSKWILKFSPVAQKRKGDKISGPLMHAYVPVDADGLFYPSPRDPKHKLLNVVAVGYFNKDGRRLDYDECFNVEHVSSELLMTAYLAVSFAHCRNVKISDRDPNEENEKLAKKQKAKTKGRGFVKFKTLEIPKMREMLDALKEFGEEGAKPFHIVRGHFKTYTKERPLFGRIVGQYYWGSQFRGVVNDGATLKDYSVGPQPPQRGLQKPGL